MIITLSGSIIPFCIVGVLIVILLRKKIMKSSDSFLGFLITAALPLMVLCLLWNCVYNKFPQNNRADHNQVMIFSDGKMVVGPAFSTIPAEKILYTFGKTHPEISNANIDITISWGEDQKSSQIVASWADKQNLDPYKMMKQYISERIVGLIFTGNVKNETDQKAFKSELDRRLASLPVKIKIEYY